MNHDRLGDLIELLSLKLKLVPHHVLIGALIEASICQARDWLRNCGSDEQRELARNDPDYVAKLVHASALHFVEQAEKTISAYHAAMERAPRQSAEEVYAALLARVRNSPTPPPQ